MHSLLALMRVRSNVICVFIKQIQKAFLIFIQVQILIFLFLFNIISFFIFLFLLSCFFKDVLENAFARWSVQVVCSKPCQMCSGTKSTYFSPLNSGVEIRTSVNPISYGKRKAKPYIIAWET